MSVVFSDSFTNAGSDVGIVVWDGNSYVYVIGSGTDLTVNATNDRVQCTVVDTDKVVRIKNASVPTTGNGIVSATIHCGAVVGVDDLASLCVRLKTDDTHNFYLALLDRRAQTGTIIRWSAGTPDDIVVLYNPARAIGASHTATFRAVTNGSQVDLTLTISGLTDVTYSDTAANRKLDGTPGIHFYDATANEAYLDDLSVDDTPAGATLVQSHYRWRNDDGALTA